MLQHDNKSKRHDESKRNTWTFPLLGGTGAAAIVLGALAHSLPLTLAGIACAAVGGAGAVGSSRNATGKATTTNPEPSANTESVTATSKGKEAANLDNATEKPHEVEPTPEPAQSSEASSTAPVSSNPEAVHEDAPEFSQDSGQSAPEAKVVTDAGTVANTSAQKAAPEETAATNALSSQTTSEASKEVEQPKKDNDLSASNANEKHLESNTDDAADKSSSDPTHFASISKRLLASSDPIAEVKLIVSDIHQREIDADIDSDSQAPTAAESYLARRLDEAGLFDTSMELPAVRIVSPRRTHLFYLRTSSDMTYGAKLRIIAIEGALNAFCFINRYFKNPEDATFEQMYQLFQGLTNSVCAQIPSITMELPREGEPLSDPDGEWMVREILGQAIETVQTPYRLTATYRSNVACGDVAIQVDLTPASVFPKTAWVPDLGIVPTTSDMRRQEASRYGLRMGIMLAACAFHASQHVRHVWVQGVIDTPSSHKCYYHARIDRSSFRWIEMDHIVDPISCLLCLGGTLKNENGILQPIEDGFSLDDERFCPPRRFEPVALSTRTLKPRYARALGTKQVSGLAIDESEERSVVADDVVRRLNDSTEQNVRMIFDLANKVDDPTVHTAAKRTATKLIEGTLSDTDALAVREEFVNGDDLTQAVQRANEQLQDADFSAAQDTLQKALAPIDEAHTYDDTSEVAWRTFDTYVDRTLYNRLHTDDKRTVKLVPHEYLEAHMALAIALLANGNVSQALEHARRGHQLAPDSSWTSLNLVTCLQVAGKDDEAMKELDDLLKVAHDPQGIGLAYYQMAHLQWGQGNLLAARACFEHIPRSLGSAIPTLNNELAMLASENGGMSIEPLSDEDSNKILREHGIPVAPSEKIAHYFYEGLAASFDAEVFPVAKSFIDQLGELSGDDVVMNVIRSVEGEPDE